MFFFGTNALHFSEEFYGTVLLIDGIAQVLGVPSPPAVFSCDLCSKWQSWSTSALHLIRPRVILSLPWPKPAPPAGVAIYNFKLRSVTLKKVFFWTALALIGVHLMQLILVEGVLALS